MSNEIKKTPMKELKEILSCLEPFEKAWCNEINAYVMSFPTGFFITYYDVTHKVTPIPISSFFIPNAEENLR